MEGKTLMKDRDDTCKSLDEIFEIVSELRYGIYECNEDVNRDFDKVLDILTKEMKKCETM